MPNYDYWKDSLAGKKPKMFVDSPELGFYRKGVYERDPKGNNRRVGWTPVAIFMHDGALAAAIGSRPLETDRDKINEIWSYCAANAISEKWFRAVERGEPWPDAHDATKNKPAEPVKDLSQDGENGKPLALADVKELPEQKLVRELADAKAGVSQYDKIDSDTMAGQALSLKNTITTKAGDLDKIREALVRPHIDAQRDVNDRINPHIKDAKLQTATLLQSIGAWEDQKREAARIAEQARQTQIQEHAAAALKAKQSDAPPPPPLETVKSNVPPPSTQVAAAVGRKASVKVSKFVTKIDLDKAFAQFRNEPAVNACLIALAQRAVDAGLSVDGAIIEERSVVR